jgi:hypothetical protein
MDRTSQFGDGETGGHGRLIIPCRPDPGGPFMKRETGAWYMICRLHDTEYLTGGRCPLEGETWITISDQLPAVSAD